MGTVTGVHLKYVAWSGMSAYAAHRLRPEADDWTDEPIAALSTAVMLFAAVQHALIACFFVSRKGMSLIGKDPVTGKVPLWSYVVWSAFHLPTWLYTLIHTEMHIKTVPVATEVAPGWWIGGRYGARLKKKWAATVDCTTEFDEGCRATTEEYLLLACWDGVPPTPPQIEKAAALCARMSARGDIMVHCAHGRGRSTCVMVACLVRAGVYPNWRAALEGVRLKRRVCKLNGKMRAALDAWEAEYGPAGRE